MAIALELMWWRCVDGAVAAEFEESPGMQGRAVLLTAQHEGGVWVQNRSSKLRPYHLRNNDLKRSMLEAYLRCISADDFVEFVAEYGLPGPAEGADGTEQSLKNLRQNRDALRKLLDLSQAGKHHEFASAFNSANSRTPRLAPLFNLWTNRLSPTLTFMPSDPNGFMLMQVALAHLNQTTLLTCLQCGSPFLGGGLTSKRTNAFYCSNRCRVAHQRRPETKTRQRTARRRK